MALSEENTGMVMPVAPAYGGGNGGFGFGGDWGWIILLLLFAGGGWGNGFGGGYGNSDFPWLMTGQQAINANTNNGFRDAMLNDGISSIQNSINGISTQLCNGFASVEQGASARQIANMQTAFANQTAMNQGFNSVANQLSNCCCENRASIADLKYTVATENCADRAAVADGIRDVIASQTASTQRILDQMCADKIDAKNDVISQLRQELLYARGQASQNAQTAAILTDNLAQTNTLERYLAPVPIPAYVVPNPNALTV